MPLRYEPIEIRPKDGGALLSNLSADNIGIANYQDKLNFRRYIDRELRREGHAINGEDGDPVEAALVQAVTDEIWIYPKAESIGEPRTYQLLEFAPITL